MDSSGLNGAFIVIPIRSNVQKRIPSYVTIGLIAINAVVFLYQVSLREPMSTQTVYRYGFVPARVSAWMGGREALQVDRSFNVRTRYGLVPLFTIQMSLPADPQRIILTIFTAMFMHGGWLHFGFNMWFLWIFGGNIEDRLGHGFYAIFYLFCGVCAAGLQTLLDIGSDTPMIGASGAIAGVLGAYLIAYPWARVLTLLPIFFFWQFIEIPALFFLGLWFVMQFFSGWASIAQVQEGGVAYWAHVGGFAAGVLIMLVLKRIERLRRPPSRVEVILPGEQWHRDTWGN